MDMNAIVKLMIVGMTLAGSPAMMAQQVNKAQQESKAQVNLQKDTGLVFKKSEHDFGVIKEFGAIRTCIFEYVNKTKEDVVIYEVVPSCSCTKAEWKRTPIKPGEPGKIRVTFKNEFGACKFEKPINIYTSLTARPIIIKIKGEIVEE